MWNPDRTTGGVFCPHCHMPGIGVHYTGCPELKAPDTVAPRVLTEADIRRIVREELERAHPTVSEVRK